MINASNSAGALPNVTASVIRPYSSKKSSLPAYRCPRWLICRFTSFINFSRTERKRQLAERTYSPRFAVQCCFRSIGVRHGAACLLEGIPEAVPCFLPHRPVPGYVGTRKDQFPSTQYKNWPQ